MTRIPLMPGAPHNDVVMELREKEAANRTRSLSEIARDIRTHWPNMSVHARPYANAMMSLDSIKDDFYSDSAQSVVLYFLSNAATWRGADAKRIKGELKKMVRKNGYPI